MLHSVRLKIGKIYWMDGVYEVMKDFDDIENVNLNW